MKSFLIPSRSEPNVKRQVIIDDKGYYHCTCPVYAIKHKECYHIQKVKFDIDKLPIDKG